MKGRTLLGANPNTPPIYTESHILAMWDSVHLFNLLADLII